jgi:hypothetical protein
MRYNTTLNYFRKIQRHLTEEEFTTIEDVLFKVPENQLEAFWHLIGAGYPLNFAIMNYINIYEYVRDNSIDYKTALTIIHSVYTGLNIGTNSKKTKPFSLN